MMVRMVMRKATRTIDLTERDRSVLDVLTTCVRLLSLPQIARTFWRQVRVPVVAARRRLTVLEEAGLLDCLTVLARPELTLTAPVIRWMPGIAPPNFGSAAHQLQARWDQPPMPTIVVVATARAGHWRGGQGGRRPRTSEATHDLHLAAVYLKFLAEQPDLAKFWVSESSLVQSARVAGMRLPDAMIQGPEERKVIEFGGAYSKSKLAEFHAFCCQEKLAYEVW